MHFEPDTKWCADAGLLRRSLAKMGGVPALTPSSSFSSSIWLVSEHADDMECCARSIRLRRASIQCPGRALPTAFKVPRGLSNNDKSTDHDVVSGLRESSRADVGEEGPAG